MKNEVRKGAESRLRTLAIGGLFLTFLCLPIGASAALGGGVSSVEADQQQMKAMRAVHAKPNYTVHEITTPYGTTVREYVSPDGKVFGVAWRGPFLPNMQQLLGSYYGQFEQSAQAARAQQPRRSRNAPLTVKQPELVVHSGGHMRAYAGHAYVPGMVPPGVATQEIR
ncbi:MAG: DUF2844 domain-containing protein [Candidatus Korobacteraceae bacterium]